MEIAKNVCDPDNHFAQLKKSGLSHGAAVARGEILDVDSDDYIKPNLCEL